MTADSTQLKELPPDGLIGKLEKAQRWASNNQIHFIARSQYTLASIIHSKAINCTSLSDSWSQPDKEEKILSVQVLKEKKFQETYEKSQNLIFVNDGEPEKKPQSKTKIPKPPHIAGAGIDLWTRRKSSKSQTPFWQTLNWTSYQEISSNPVRFVDVQNRW